MITLGSILSKLREMKPVIKERYKVSNLELFGSYVKKTENSNSDIDILVEFEETADLFDLIRLSQFLEKELNSKVDIIPKQSLKEELKEEVFKEAIAI